MQDWQTRFQMELEQAEAARRAGNEGKARVCARRAVGILAGEYLAREGELPAGSSAYDRLRQLLVQPDLTSQTRAAIQHFLERVTPEHTLPVEADLVAEARWLARTLLP